MVPGPGLFGQQVRRLFQPLNRLGIVACVNESFALQQRARARLPASVEQEQAENGQKQRRKRGDQFFNGHHQARW